MFVLCFRFSRPCLFNDKWIWGLTFVYKPVKLINSPSVCCAWWRTKSGPKIRSVLYDLFSYCSYIKTCDLCWNLRPRRLMFKLKRCTPKFPRGRNRPVLWHRQKLRHLLVIGRTAITWPLPVISENRGKYHFQFYPKTYLKRVPAARMRNLLLTSTVISFIRHSAICTAV
jgi:hypothetical protein